MRLFKVFARHFAKLFLIMLIMLLLTVPLVWLHFDHPEQANSLANIIAHHSVFFTIGRWLLIVSFIALWPTIVRSLAKKQDWGSEKLEFWLAQRYRLAGWLIVFELVVCENLLLTLIKLV